MHCVFAMHNYNDCMQVHHSKSNCHTPEQKTTSIWKRKVTQMNYSVFELFFHLPSYKKCTHGFPYIQFDAILHVHAFSMFQKEIHLQEIMVLESVTCIRIGGRKVFAYYVGLTIFDCFLIKRNKNPDNDDVFDSGLCSKVSTAARKQKKPGSRVSHLDR